MLHETTGFPHSKGNPTNVTILALWMTRDL